MNLPIFDESRELILDSGRLRQIASSSEINNALRFVDTRGPIGQSLEERLDIAQYEYSQLATMCGAKLIDFTYGLYPVKEKGSYSDYTRNIVPDRYVLAAEIELIKDIKRFKLPTLDIARGIRQYRNQRNILADDSIRQFKFSEKDDQWYLLDIEPRLRFKPDLHNRIFTRP